MRMCKVALLARASLHRSTLEWGSSQGGGMPLIWLTNTLRISTAAPPSERAAYSAAAVQPRVADDHDSSSAGSSHDMSPRSSANPAVSRISSSSVAEQPGSRKQQPVQLSDVVRALDFDWDEIGSEESDTASNQQRAHSGLSASTSEIMSSGTGYKSAKKWRAPSEGWSPIHSAPSITCQKKS